MRVTVNGRTRELPDGAGLAAVVNTLTTASTGTVRKATVREASVSGGTATGVAGIGSGERAGRPRGVAVAVNGSVVPATEWAATTVREGDTVEVVTAHQGG